VSSALDEFRAQREAAEAVHARLTEVANLLLAIRAETAALALDAKFRSLLRHEETWLIRAQELVRDVGRFREHETYRLWPAVWRRWAVAVALVLVTALAAGAGYVWAWRPYEEELRRLRYQAELGTFVSDRFVHMTPAQRRQFDALMNWDDAAKK
jgi:hypothetical protein